MYRKNGLQVDTWLRMNFKPVLLSILVPKHMCYRKVETILCTDKQNCSVIGKIRTENNESPSFFHGYPDWVSVGDWSPRQPSVQLQKVDRVGSRADCNARTNKAMN